MATFSNPPSLLPVPSWDWALDVRYFRYDVVRHGGAAWFLRTPTSTGEEPGVTEAWLQLGWVSDVALPDVGSAGVCGDASHVAALRTDSKGRVTAANAVAIQIAISQVDGLADVIAALEAAHVPTDGLTIHYNGAGKLEVIGVPASGITGTVTDSQLAEPYLKADGTRALSGDLSAGSYRVTNLADPTSPQDAATQNWVEGQFEGLAPVATSGSAADLTGVLPPAHGGTGLSAVGAADQFLAMNHGGTALEYKSLAGTANQVTVSNSSGAVTLGLPQNIGTGASPQFSGLKVSGLSALQFVRTDASKNLVTGSIGASDLPTIPVTGGGTGLTGLSLGDLWYGSAANAAARLAGNVSTNRMFLRQVGNGSVSAPPVWDVLTAADIPSLPYVTSAGLTMPGIFAVSSSPITSSGTFGVTLNAQAANQVWAGPSSGAAAVPAFRPLVAADIPGLSYVTSVALSLPAMFNVTGSPVTTSGTLGASLANQAANVGFFGPASGGSAAPAFRSLVAADLPTVPVSGGGTGLTALALGDLWYGSAANTTARLSGNTAATRQVLTQVGTGSASAAPSWTDQLQGITLWNASTTYAVGDLAVKSTNIYRCITSNSNNDPSSDGGTNWELFIVRASTTLAVASGGRFTSLSGAWNFAKNSRIMPSALLTITLGAGTFTESAALSVNHPDGIRVKITGAGSGATTVSFNATGAGTPGIIVGYEQSTQQGGGALGFLDALTIKGTWTYSGSGGNSAAGYSQTGVWARENGSITMGTDVKIDSFYYGAKASHGGYLEWQGGTCTGAGDVAIHAIEGGFCKIGVGPRSGSSYTTQVTVSNVKDTGNSLGTGYMAEAGGRMSVAGANATGCNLYGCQVNNGTMDVIGTGTFSGNTSHGLYVLVGGIFNSTSNIVANSNGGRGIMLDLGMLSIVGTTTCNGNTLDGIYLRFGAARLIGAVVAGVSGSPNSGPAGINLGAQSTLSCSSNVSTQYNTSDGIRVYGRSDMQVSGTLTSTNNGAWGVDLYQNSTLNAENPTIGANTSGAILLQYGSFYKVATRSNISGTVTPSVNLFVTAAGAQVGCYCGS